MYSAKDIEELNAKNIEYPEGSMHTLYDAEQQQRAFERKIRETKRILAACDEALNNPSDEELLQKLEKIFSHYSSKLKRQESELNGFCKRTGLLPDGSRSQVYGFGKSTSQKSTGVAKKYYRTWSKEHNINNIETLAEYYDVKYNDIERYKLLKGYVKAIDEGNISPFTGFDLCESKADEIRRELVGLKINSNPDYDITDFTTHFVDRVLGQTSTKHKDMRLGTTLEQLKNTIANPISISEPSFISMKKNGSVYLDKRVKFTGKSCSFVYSITDKLLIQATSFGGG